MHTPVLPQAVDLFAQHAVPEGRKGQLLAQDGSMDDHRILHLDQLQAQAVGAIHVRICHVPDAPAVQPKALVTQVAESASMLPHMKRQ